MAASRTQPSRAAVPARSLLDSRAVAAGVCAIAVIFMLALNVPWQPVRGATIGLFDYSWMLVLHDAIATGRQFGSELIVPYGPLGFIATNVYDPRTYLVLLAIRIVLALVALRLLWEAGKKSFASPLAALPWMLAIIFLMSPGITTADSFDPRSLGGAEDHFFSICAILALLDYFAIHRRVVTPGVLAMAALLAAASLAKVNFFLQDLVVIGAISLDQLLGRGRRAWLVPAVYAGCVALFYLAARQSPASLGRFLWGWIQVSSAHMDDVGLPGILVDLIVFLFATAVVLALAARVEWKAGGRLSLLPIAALTALLFLLYKHSFVRQDFAHATIAPIGVLAAALVYAPLAWKRLTSRADRLLCLAAVALAGMVVASTLSEFTDQGLGGYAVASLRRTGNAFAALARNATHSGALRDDWERDRASLRAMTRLPAQSLTGPADVYPHRQAVLFAYALAYDPRPAFSSLFATAPALAKLNVGHLRGIEAPRTILIDIEPVDRQFPSLADGLSWPDLLTRYDIADASGSMLILHRASVPRRYAMVPLKTISARLDQPALIPDATSAPLWARIRFHRRLAGRLASAVYKPPLIQLEVASRDGSIAQYRLLPALAGEGFLLSPVVKSSRAFAQLAGLTWRADLAPAIVDQITLSVVDGSPELNYDPVFEIELDQLELQR